MPRKHLLAIDQGTTNTKVLVIDQDGEVVARASREVPIEFPHPGWVEQDAPTLWRSVVEAMNDAIAATGSPALEAVGLTNQRESVVVWERSSGRPVGPCITWQCRRTAPACAALRDRGVEAHVRTVTGLPLDPLFSASKARWLLDHTPDGVRRATDGELCIGTVDSWLLWNLSDGRTHACDASNASRTQLLNLTTLSWDAELLELFGIPIAALPRIVPSSGIAGESAGSGSLPAGVPIASLIGDSHAALFGHALCRLGVVKATYGTGSSLMRLLATPVMSQAALSTTVAWQLPDRAWYALEGNITVTGGAVDWLGRVLGLEQPASGVASIASGVSDTGGVYLVPAFAGLGAPHWDENARGLLYGLTRGTTAAHIALATVQSIAYQVRDVFAAMGRDAAAPLPELLADGGASRNDTLMQFQADILGVPVVRNRSADVAAMGAAWLAGLAVGVWTSMADVESLRRPTDRFEPKMPEDERERLYAGWQDAVARSASAVSRSTRTSDATERVGGSGRAKPPGQ
jgi:glycerol kinase